jgi:hypothetical protein
MAFTALTPTCGGRRLGSPLPQEVERMSNPVLRVRCFMRIHRWRPIHLGGEVGRECRDCGERVFDRPGGPKLSIEEGAGMLDGISGTGGGG